MTPFFLIYFVFVNECTIALKIKQLAINNVLIHCRNLLDQAKERQDSASAMIFCQCIDDLMNSEKASDVYTSIFNEESLLQQLKKEFKVYALMNQSGEMKHQIHVFRDTSLPYLPAVNPTVRVNDQFYSCDFLMAFKVLLDAKLELEGRPILDERHVSGENNGEQNAEGIVVAPLDEEEEEYFMPSMFM